MSFSSRPLLSLSPTLPSPVFPPSPQAASTLDTIHSPPSEPSNAPQNAPQYPQLVLLPSPADEAHDTSHNKTDHKDPSGPPSQLRPSKSTQERPGRRATYIRHSRSVSQSTIYSQAGANQRQDPAVELSSSVFPSIPRINSNSLAPQTELSKTWSGHSGDFHSGSIYGSGRRDPDKRVIYINNPDKTNDRYEYAGNRVQTSKYTVFSFLPKNLFEQFHRIAYIYFLVILCLNQIPQLAVFGRFASALPLAFVLFITAIKDGYEDWRRHRSDKKENNRLALVFHEGDYKPKPWKHIRVGDLVKVQANETIPCDLALLRTSDPNGIAFVQTINLDGESNLKSRYALLESAARLEASENVSNPRPMTGRLLAEKPNRNIYGFIAYLELDDRKQLPLGPTNIILRGCELKNTSWVVGVAVYTGQETKAMLNSSGAQSKRSRLEQKMNRETLWLSALLFTICMVGGLGMGLWLKRHDKYLDEIPYFGGTDYKYYGKFAEGIFAFLSCVISFQVMIPISLYISMELVRLGQSYLMIQDSEMYHSESDTRLQCRALNINEDLGQIKYVFSDKTGTLTENKMEFRSASIFGQNYSGPKVADAPADDLEGSVCAKDRQVVKEVLGDLIWKPKAGVKVDPNLVRMLQGSDEGAERKAVHDFLLTLAACNTVVPTKVRVTSSGNLEMEAALAADEGTGLVEYQGESPDEQALVSAAASYGYTLIERTSNYMVINILGQVYRYHVLGLHEFDSTRKCMSVVLRCPDDSIKVLVKGADSSVLQKISVTTRFTQLHEAHQAQIIFDTQMHLDLYSKEGLRTLVVAARGLNSDELREWQKCYAKANASLLDRGELLRDAANLVEKDLFLLGATGIEDKLQVGVPETIATLRDAGMKVWVLTGDKQETAISIGFSCALLTNEMKQIIINASDKEACREALKNAKATYVISTERKSRSQREGRSLRALSSGRKNDADMSSDFVSSSTGQTTSASLPQLLRSGSSATGGSKVLHRDSSSTCMTRPLALIIDGTSLVHALDKDLEQELFDLATACTVVICCRVAPLQKAGIVSLVKKKSNDMTLAIGDGANDVSMIQMADVGVGISGQEGRQAVLASDFAMGQFRFLRRLLLIHGHLNYRRLSYMVLYNFYRNAVFVMLLFWYILYTAFSTSPAITEWSLVFYSLIYTSVPTIVVAMLDRDLSHDTLIKYPGLYQSGQLNEGYNRPLFWLTMLDTLWQSLVLFYVPVMAYRESTVDIWSIGSVWTISVVILVNLHLAMDIEQFTWISHVSIWGSIVATYVCLIVLDVLTDETSLTHYGVIFHVAATACYWLNILLILILGLLPRFIVKVVKQRFWPSDVQIVREEEILNKQDQNFVAG